MSMKKNGRNSAIKKKEGNPAIWNPWMNYVSEIISQGVKNEYCTVSLIGGARKDNFIETEKRMVVAKGWEEEGIR